MPPFSIPDAKVPGTGLVSKGIDTEIEHVRLANELKQGIPEKAAREAPIGLGFRVPMLIASPWSRGGKVCSEVFDHTSTLQFLEVFFSKKLNKEIRINNISDWRRTICGDLTSVFTPFNGEKMDKINFLDRNNTVETIYNAKFKGDPSGFKKITDADIAAFKSNPRTSGVMSAQEKGIRASCALPYELYADGKLQQDKKSFEIKLSAGKDVFGDKAVGAPFTVYAPVKFKDTTGDEVCRNWSFAVKAGDTLTYSWPVERFENGKYHLNVNGPNGYFRTFIGTENNPSIAILCAYESGRSAGKLTGNVLFKIRNTGAKAYGIVIKDMGYKKADMTKKIAAGATEEIVLDLKQTHGWYDFSLFVEGTDNFEQRYAGRVETGAASFSDPVMGGIV